MKYDLHIHTKYSKDGVLEPWNIVKIAKKRGLDGIAVTDHNTVRGGIETKKYETKDFKVIVGSEIKTERGEIIGLFLSDEVESRKLAEAIKEIKRQNGVVIVPHPFDSMRSSALHPKPDEAKIFDGIEAFNSRCVLKKYNEMAGIFAKKCNLPLVAGSDAHFSNEIGNAGVITQTESLREDILGKNNLKIFGKKSPLVNHGFTKVLKLWRRKTG